MADAPNAPNSPNAPATPPSGEEVTSKVREPPAAEQSRLTKKVRYDDTDAEQESV